MPCAFVAGLAVTTPEALQPDLVRCQQALNTIRGPCGISPNSSADLKGEWGWSVTVPPPPAEGSGWRWIVLEEVRSIGSGFPDLHLSHRHVWTGT
jgi:hypothetical protein